MRRSFRKRPLSLGAAGWGAVGLWVAFIILVGRPALADSPLPAPWEITADRLIHRQKPETVTAEGNVVLLRAAGTAEEMRLTADWLFFSATDRLIKARGHVFLDTGEEKINADSVEISLEEENGVLHHTSIKIPGNSLTFLGDSARKTGPYTYSIENGFVTACPYEAGKSPPWSIHAADTELTVEGYAALKNVTFHIKDVPVFYSPYLILPAKTARQSGFLFPEVSHSERNGMGIIAPIFVNLSASSDATLYPGYFSQRGGFAGAEFRYIAGPGSAGTFRVNYLDDRQQDSAADDFNNDGYYRQTRDRYWLRAKADQRLSNSVTAKLDLDVVSDRDYLQEYRDGIVGFDQSNADFLKNYHRDLQEASIPFRQSSLQATKTWNDSLAGVEMQAVKDVWGVPTATTPLQVLPRLVGAGVLPLGQLPFASQLLWQSEYVNYWRHDGDGGQRLQLAPQLVENLPFSSWLEGSMLAGINETLYMPKVYGDNTMDQPHSALQDRTLWSFGTTLGTSLSRYYRNFLGKGAGLLHLLRPEVEYSYIPGKNQDALPNLDSQDRIAARNWLQYGVTNYFRLAESENGTLHNRKFARIRLTQIYDLKEARRDLSAGEKRYPFSDLWLQSAVYPNSTVDLGYDATWSIQGEGVTSYDLTMRWHGSARGSLTVDYWYRKDREQEAPYFHRQGPTMSAQALSLAGNFALTDQLRLKGSLNHSFTNSQTRETDLQLIYAPSCWAMEAQYTKSLNDQRVAVLFSLAGLGKLLEFEF